MSETIPTDQPMQPVVIVKFGSMSLADMKRLRANGLCVVESKDPASARYMEPAPIGYALQQWAAIELSRVLLTDGTKIAGTTYRNHFAAMYADILLRGEPLKPVLPTEKK